MKKIIGALLALFSAVAFGATTVPIQLINPTGSTSGQAIVSTGASSAPAWGNVAAGSLAAQAANTVVANATASSASPTAVAVPSCSAATSALTWTSNTGFTCNTSINAATLGGATFAAPGAIGGTTPGAGSFTTLSASSNAHFYATNASAQSIPNNTATTVTGWTTVFDTGSNFNASTGVFTAPTAGVYLVTAQIGMALATWPAGATLKVQLFQNATGRSSASWANFSTATSGSISAFTGFLVFAVNCAANDTLSVQVTHNQGAALALGGGNVFSVVRIP